MLQFYSPSANTKLETARSFDEGHKQALRIKDSCRSWHEKEWV